MKKTLARRLLAAALTVCMMAVMVLPASAAYSYKLELEIVEAKTTQKHSGAKNQMTVTDESAGVSLEASLAAELVVLLGANFTDAKASKGGLWKFESDKMAHKIQDGLKAYSGTHATLDWEGWVTQFSSVDTITGGTGTDKGDLIELIKDESKTVGELEPNKDYILVYSPADDEFAAGADARVWVEGDPDNNPNYDPACGNTYTFTLRLNRATIGGGGGGGVAVPTKYAITVSEVANATVNVSATQAAAGDKITVTIAIDEGYEMVSFEVKGASGNDVAATGFGDGTYTFTMPAEAVTVTLTTKKAAEACPAAQFNDVDLNAWYHDALDYVLANKLMAGYDEKSFGPNDSLSRAMVAQIFYNLEGQPAGDYANPFPDVAEGKWYRNAISWAYANKVVAGYGDGLYRPEQDVTREELVQIFFNYAKAKGWNNGEQSDLTAFADHLKVADWHEEAVSWGISAKLLSGKGGNKIDPKVDSLRCEAAQMLMNLCENIRK